MTIFIQDTVRNNLASWGERSIRDGLAAGVILSPFASPVQGNGFKMDVDRVASRILNRGGSVWFDPMTHALQMPQVGDYRYYDQWDLWNSARNTLETESDQRDHVKRVFSIQDRLNAPYLAPTLLLHSAQSLTSQRAVSLSRIAVEEANAKPVWLSIVGDTHFWAAKGELDAHVGELDQLNAVGWHITVARPLSAVPVASHADEVEGVMRTVHALSQDRPVIVGYGDLAGLPAIAAGATAIGTGWDVRQRVCAYTDYSLRADDPGRGQWYQRPTLEGLLGGMSVNEYRVLRSQNRELADALTPGNINPGPENAFRHHIGVISSAMGELRSLSGEARVRALRSRYMQAEMSWHQAQSIAGSALGSEAWIRVALEGVDQFIASEGW